MRIYWVTKIIELHSLWKLSGVSLFILYSGDNTKGLFRTGTVQSLMVPSWSQDWAFGVRQVKPLLPAWHSSWVAFWRLSFWHGLDLKERHMHHMLNTVCPDKTGLGHQMRLLYKYMYLKYITFYNNWYLVQISYACTLDIFARLPSPHTHLDVYPHLGGALGLRVNHMCHYNWMRSVYLRHYNRMHSVYLAQTNKKPYQPLQSSGRAGRCLFVFYLDRKYNI